MIAYLAGYPPIGAGRKDLFRRGDTGRYIWAPKFFFTRGWATVWISSNPMLVSFDSGMAGGFRKYFQYFRDLKSPLRGKHSYTTQKIAEVEKILMMEKKPIFMCILAMDTHRPYNFDGGFCDIEPINPEKNFRNQVKAIEHFDGLFPELIKPFRGRGTTEIIVTSDHGELFGPIYWSHDSTTPHLIFDEKLHEVPFISGEIT